MTRATPARAATALALAAGLAVAAALALAACQAPGGTSLPTSTSALSSAGATSGATAAPSPGSGSGGTTQSDTEWGRIWDALPPSFPSPNGAIPATDTGEGATSAQLSVPRSVGDVAGFFVAELGATGWTVNRDGPLEDGSIDVTATKGDACQLAISVLPVGDGSLVKVLYGAGCPFD
jgi:hypothetical protein